MLNFYLSKGMAYETRAFIAFFVCAHLAHALRPVVRSTFAITKIVSPEWTNTTEQ